MALPVGLIIGAVGTQAAAGAWSLHQANKAKNELKRLNDDLANLESNRQPVINPYANVSNPYANLGVATKAAEFQAEQIDVSLANTLDVVRQTGAGGATALAQAALKGKQGISADIQKQEAANQKLRAQGELQVQKLKAAGEQFKWEQQEKRELQKLDRTQALIDQERATQMAAQSAAIGSLGNIGNTLTQFGLMDMKMGGAGGSDIENILSNMSDEDKQAAMQNLNLGLGMAGVPGYSNPGGSPTASSYQLGLPSMVNTNPTSGLSLGVGPITTP